MSIILALLLLIKLPALNQKAITPKEGYETISLGPVSGNYVDSKYLTAHRIPTSIFTPISNGDLDGYNVAMLLMIIQNLFGFQKKKKAVLSVLQ